MGFDFQHFFKSDIKVKTISFGKLTQIYKCIKRFVEILNVN